MSASPTFEVHTRLGSGGMAEVHLARMNGAADAEWVALKRIRGEMSDSLEHVRQFEREARICALLAHENIVALKAFGRDGTGPYLALEYVQGPSAAQLLKVFKERGRQLDERAALSIARDAARGLAYAHQLQTGASGLGVVHRDISPENVLISASGLAKLSDFGIAKVLGGTSFTKTGTVKGKFAFMAPELFDGHEADVATDLFAFGALAYALLCGVPPFPGKTEAELMRAILSATPPAPSALRTGVPPAIDSWIVRSLSKAREERPPIAELIAGADAALGDFDARALVARAVSEAFPNGAAVAVPEVPSHHTRAVVKRGHSGRWFWALAPAAAAVALLAWFARPPPPVAPPAPPPMPVVARPPPAPPEPAPVAAPTPAPVVHPAHAAAPKHEPPKKHEEPPPAPASAAPPAEAATGTVWIKVRPWARVFFDGEPKGVTPMEPFQAKAGPHSLLLVNEELNERRTYPVDVKPGAETDLKYSLDAP